LEIGSEEWVAWRLENTSRLLGALENLWSGCGETEVGPSAETEGAAVVDNLSWCDRDSWIGEGWGECWVPACRGLMVKKVPNEESPSFKEAKERVASSMLDIRPGKECCPLVFLRTGKGISSSVHFRLVGMDIGRGTPVWLVVVVKGTEGVVDREEGWI